MVVVSHGSPGRRTRGGGHPVAVTCGTLREGTQRTRSPGHRESLHAFALQHAVYNSNTQDVPGARIFLHAPGRMSRSPGAQLKHTVCEAPGGSLEPLGFTYGMLSTPSALPACTDPRGVQGGMVSVLTQRASEKGEQMWKDPATAHRSLHHTCVWRQR